MSTLAAFPADDPIWNTDGLNRTTPTVGKQALGWVLGEEPPSATFNWWMFYVHEYVQHYKTAAQALNDGKLDRDGGNTITGNIAPDGDNTRTLGSTASRIAMVHAYLLGAGVSVFIPTGKKGIQVSDGLGSAAKIYMMSDARVVGNLIPDVASDDDLGSAALPWRDLFIDNVYVSDGGSVSPGGFFKTAVLGSDSAPWATITGKSMVAKLRIASFSSENHPSSDLEMISMNQCNNILACGKINGATGAIIAGSDFNVASVAFSTNPGRYTVTLDRAVSDECCVVATAENTDHLANAQVSGSGGSVTIAIRDNSTQPPTYQNSDWSFVVTGRPRTLVTDTII